MTHISHSARFVAALSLAVVIPLGFAGQADSAQRQARAPGTRSPELSTTTRLADRRSLALGDRFYEMGAEDATYPATGWHIRGEMGGFWTPPIKLLDGVWFKAGDTWLKARKYTSGWGYLRMALGTHDGVRISRTDFAPDGLRAGLIGLHLSSPTATTLDLAVDAHSELMKVYPWGWTTPSQSTYNLQDTGRVSGSSLLFREDGTPPVPNAEAHHYAALVGSTLTPRSSALGPDFRGPQGAVICSDTTTVCDDSAFGKGTGGELPLPGEGAGGRADRVVRGRRLRPERA